MKIESISQSLLFCAVLLCSALPVQLRAQFNRNDSMAIDTSIQTRPVGDRWDLDCLIYGEIDDVILERLEGDLLIVRRGDELLAVPVGSVLEWERSSARWSPTATS